MKHGILTARMANVLSQEFKAQGFDVLFDHGKKGADTTDKIGRIVSWFGTEYKRDTLLAFLDIAVVLCGSGKTFALIEIEETTAKPKVLLGDVLTTLIGGGIKFQGKRDLQVGQWTTLIVLAHSRTQSHQAQVNFLKKQTKHLKSVLSTPNASIGQIVIDTFRCESELENKLKQHIKNSLSQNTRP